LSGKTGYAILITSAGLVITLIVNVLFMPHYGYMAAAWGHLASYLVMTLICALLGYRHYPVPYNWLRNGLYIFMGVGLYCFSLLFSEMDIFPKLAVNTGIILLYVFIWAGVEGFYKKLHRRLQRR
ncbi:MAG TPA: polysaccharide biosynthesis C-terminal domain-containing protein, partial [Bacteroidales bacterium]|nr:polysaccharide biosynthesis C-terminal domain-containing protein [Bacteroidales bacterium]